MKTFFSYKALQSQRSSGYKGTAFALAELIDNSLDANATQVKIVFFERRDHNQKRYVDEILVCDDGDGMDKARLQTCLQFGSSGNEDIEELVKKKKKGKFGFGLPNASLSQSPNIHVISKTKKEAWRTTYLTLDELKENESIEIPDVQTIELPKHYLDAGAVLNAEHGTIIAWRNCDRLSNTRAETIIQKSEALLGRLYRYLLQAGKTITLEVYEQNPKISTFSLTKARTVRLNDPLFLMSDALISEALFIEAHKAGDVAHPETNPATYYKRFSTGKDKSSPTSVLLKDHSYLFSFRWRGKEFKFALKTSYAHLDIQKPGIREGGKTQVGQFYASRKSISFIRADREISTDTYGFYKETEPRNRWWAIEIQFNPDADDLLGVHNNKQGIEFWKTEQEDITEEFNEHTATLQQAREKLWIELTKKISAAYQDVWRKHVLRQHNDWETQHANSSTTSGGTGLPGSTDTTTNATRVTDGERKRQFSEEQKQALFDRLQEKYPNIDDREIDAAIEKFDEWKVRGCILYCASPGAKTLWSHTSVMGFLVILINTENEFYKSIIAPFRIKRFESALSAIELFISSLAWEENDRFGSNENALEILEQFRNYVGLHLDRYLKDNGIAVTEEDLVHAAGSEEEAE